ncbi:TonB-dependent receptor [Mucilaginibacter aquatilis]|uniref:TonB-dependent receptor n=1 Tax=Mucilaginibacter aquatilis TaxID=1517760 RepID=A0A6I4ICD5_9SPHI|nr:TonB-dependent receptor plug domain-containing protein [Mucilaginibacter aquatilis]MVN91236.1 TonB-dependent receptor [Mucilaginibacter aquatilis]
MIKYLLCCLLVPCMCLSQVKAQKADTCASRLAIARDMYDGGKLNDALKLVEEFYKCSGQRTSEYYKLKAKIYLALDSNSYSLRNITEYVKSKPGNYVTDDDPAVFKSMVQYVQDSLAERQISSVSKRPEDIDLTPASVIVVKYADMVKRGYGNLVDLLSDLPGFNISRTNSVTYANIYQRGFRQENTERTLFMIDGVEENDVWSNIAYISRQYPLTNISEVEVIYGPASTLYGPRAFVGAINIITKSYKDLTQTKSQPFTAGTDSAALGLHATANLSYGSYNTRNLDVTIGGKTSNFTYMLSGAYYQSNERNLDFQSFYQYGPQQVDKISNATYAANLNRLSYTGTQAAVDAAIARYGAGNFVSTRNADGSYTARVNPAAINTLIDRARAADKATLSSNVNGNPWSYANSAADWFVSGKVRSDNFEAGFRTWKLKESFNYYQSLYAAGTKNGSAWAPINTTLYTTYDKRFENITFSNLTSYEISGLDKASNLVTANTFYSETSRLSLFNLIEPTTLIDGNMNAFSNRFYYYKGQQFRTDSKVTYAKNKFSILGGFEYRYSQLQGDYLTYTNFATAEPIDQSNVAYAQEQGTTATLPRGGNQYNTMDIGVYSQATYQLKDSLLYATAGGRFDYNRINTNAGFGQVFSPKLALVASLKKAVLKLIYSQGIQNPSQFTKFSTSTTRNANPTLRAEKIRNYEFIVLNKHGVNAINWDLSVAYSSIIDAVSSGPDPNNAGRTINQNNGQYTIFTGQGNLLYHPQQSHWDAYFNVTYTRARQTANSSVIDFQKQIIADIAPWKFNAGVNYAFNLSQSAFNINLRGNYVDAKPVGEGTTVPANAGVDGTNYIPRFVLFNSALTYQNKRYNCFTLQFVVNNILNTLYYNPGPRNANANFTTAISGFVPYVAQRDRNFLITLKFNL